MNNFRFLCGIFIGRPFPAPAMNSTSFISAGGKIPFSEAAGRQGGVFHSIGTYLRLNVLS